MTIARQADDRFGEEQALAKLGNTYYLLGELTRAIEYLQQHLVIVRQTSGRVGEGKSLNNLGLALFQSGKLKEAERTLRNGIQVWESTREKLGSDDIWKVTVFEEQARTYRLLQQVLIALKKTDAALEIAERGRARAFVELLARQLDSNLAAKILPPTIQQIKQIAKEQNATLVEYSIILDEKLLIWVIKPTGEVAFRSVDLKSLDTTLADVAERSRVAAATGSTRGTRQQDGILSDFVRGTRDSISAESSDIAFNPTAAGESPSRTNNRRLQQMHQLLIQPIANLLPTDPNARVIFIPHESLFLVPFPALQDANGKYLIEKHTILTAPAIGVLELTHRQRQRVSGKDVLVVGNPTMPSVPPKVGEPPEQLAPLPGAEKEAITIARLFNTKPLTGKVATKAAIFQQLPTSRIIHLATHGLLDDFTGSGVPGAVALAPASKDNGLLTASEILKLKFNAELVVLSACNTGRGRVTGDGVVGLSRSLISAGVPSVIVSLWFVPDAPTSSLMTEFYRQLQLNPDKATALRQAMLITMKQHPEPRDWAAFTLIGEAN